MLNHSSNTLLNGNESFGIKIGVVESVNGFLVVINDEQSGISRLTCNLMGQSFNSREKEGSFCIPTAGTLVAYTIQGGGHGLVLGAVIGTVNDPEVDIIDEPQANPGFEDFSDAPGRHVPSDGGFQAGDKGFINGTTSKIKLKRSGLAIIKASVNNWQYRIPGSEKDLNYCFHKEHRLPGQLDFRRTHLDEIESFSCSYARDDIYINPAFKDYLLREERGYLDHSTVESSGGFYANEMKGMVSQRQPNMPIKRHASFRLVNGSLQEVYREEHRYDGSYHKRYSSNDGSIFNCKESQLASGARKLTIGIGGQELFELEISEKGKLTIVCDEINFKARKDITMEAMNIHTFGQSTNKVHGGQVETGGQFNAMQNGMNPNKARTSLQHLPADPIRYT